jgi:hypothetical protein
MPCTRTSPQPLDTFLCASSWMYLHRRGTTAHVYTQLSACKLACRLCHQHTRRCLHASSGCDCNCQHTLPRPLLHHSLTSPCACRCRLRT